MSVNKTDLSYLGLEYQERLLSQILTDNVFAESILGVLNPNYFSNEHLKIISSELINGYRNEDVLLDYGSLQIRLNDKFQKDELIDGLTAYIEKLKTKSLNDWKTIQDKAIKFCKTQELANVVNKMSEDVKKGNIDQLLQYEEKFNEIMNIGIKDQNVVTNFDNINDILMDDFRMPIPTGIEGIDIDMNGGLSRGELGIVLAPLGIGKTSTATYLANTAYNLGLNVLQICFEDQPKQIQRKHAAKWCNMPINDLAANKEEVVRIVNEKTKNNPGNLIIVKMSSIDTTMKYIKNYVKDLKQKGIVLDLMIIDYIDCVQPSRVYADQNVAEGMIMREYESLLSEFNIAGYAMTQGNRASLSSKVVDTDQMGGSIKKAQIGHFILSIARTIEQKKENKATLAILKSRFGRDGIVYDNVIFNNGTLEIKVLPNIDGTDQVTAPQPAFNTISTVDSLLKTITQNNNNI